MYRHSTSRAGSWLFLAPAILGFLLLVGMVVLFALAGNPFFVKLLFCMAGFVPGIAVALLATLRRRRRRLVAGLLLVASVLAPVGSIFLALYVVNLPLWWLPNMQTNAGSFSFGFFIMFWHTTFQRFLRPTQGLRDRRSRS